MQGGHSVLGHDVHGGRYNIKNYPRTNVRRIAFSRTECSAYNLPGGDKISCDTGPCALRAMQVQRLQICRSSYIDCSQALIILVPPLTILTATAADHRFVYIAICSLDKGHAYVENY